MSEDTESKNEAVTPSFSMEPLADKWRGMRILLRNLTIFSAILAVGWMASPEVRYFVGYYVNDARSALADWVKPEPKRISAHVDDESIGCVRFHVPGSNTTINEARRICLKRERHWNGETCTCEPLRDRTFIKAVTDRYHLTVNVGPIITSTDSCRNYLEDCAIFGGYWSRSACKCKRDLPFMLHWNPRDMQYRK